MNVQEKLKHIHMKALEDEALRIRFLETRNALQPLQAFCRLCRETGYEIYPMELIDAGEDAYAAMKRAANGGGENSPELAEWGHDVCEEFFIGLSRDEE